MSNTSDPGRAPGSMHTGMRAVRSPFVDWTTDAASWMDQGSCVGTPNPNAFFGDHPGEINAAKKICHTCPVEQLCLERALKLEETGIQWGVWGGMSAEERKQIRNRQRNAKGPIVVTVGPPNGPKPQGRANGPKCGSEYGASVHERNGELVCYRCREARMDARARRREATRA